MFYLFMLLWNFERKRQLRQLWIFERDIARRLVALRCLMFPWVAANGATWALRSPVAEMSPAPKERKAASSNACVSDVFCHWRFLPQPLLYHITKFLPVQCFVKTLAKHSPLLACSSWKSWMLVWKCLRMNGNMPGKLLLTGPALLRPLHQRDPWREENAPAPQAKHCA